MLKLYDFLPSGNCYKVRLLLAQLDRPFRRIDTNIVDGTTRTPEFLAKNPNGRVPLLELDDGRMLAESNAILWFLADATPFVPRDAYARALSLQWLFFEQYSHEPYIATSRYLLSVLGAGERYRDEIRRRREPGLAALGVMEAHLSERTFFIEDRYSIADIALYAYTHVAPEGGFSLEPYPAIRRWIERVQAQPGHVSITTA